VLEITMRILLAALAGCQMTETLHHGSLFASWRKKARDWRSDPRWVVSKTGELFECPFCLSHWACALSFAWLWWFPITSFWQFPVAALAATRLAQLLNDATHDIARGPPSDDDDDLIEQSVSLDE